MPKTPGARHSQGFSSTKWGSGSLNRFCTVYRVLLLQEIKVFSKFVPAFGANSLLIPVIVTRCQPKAFAGAVRHSNFCRCPGGAALSPSKGKRAVCLQATFPVHTLSLPETPRGILRLEKAGSAESSGCLRALRWVWDTLSFQEITYFSCLPIVCFWRWQEHIKGLCEFLSSLQL